MVNPTSNPIDQRSLFSFQKPTPVYNMFFNFPASSSHFILVTGLGLNDLCTQPTEPAKTPD